MGRSRLVLAVSSDNSIKEMIRHALAAANYKVSFISSIMEVNEAIMAFKPCAIVQDWNSVAESQARQFHYKFSDKESSEGLIRVIVASKVTPQLKIFCKDALVEDVISYSNAKMNLGQELDRLFFVQGNSPLHDIMRDIRKDISKYDQKTLDDKIEEAIKIFPEDPDVQIEFGGLCLRKENLKECQKQSSLVLHKDPANLRAMNLLARSLMKSGDFQQATELLEKANLLSPKNPKRLMLLGDAFYGKGDIDKAIKYYEEAAEEDDDLAADVGKKCGTLKLESGDIDHALEIFKSSLSEDEAASVFNNVGVAIVKEERYEEALQLYQTALKALHAGDKYKVQILFNIALCYFKMRDNQQASKYIKKILRLDPQFQKAIKLSDKIAA